MPGAVAGGDTGDVACDHYHRWRDDLDLLAAMRIESYRFSIAWPRVQPDGRGALNRKGVRFYRRLVEGLLERGIEPVATLYHWDLPQALQDGGGWAARDTAERFAEYARAMADELGDVVAQWITHNEPWVVAFLGHAEGRKAPGHPRLADRAARRAPPARLPRARGAGAAGRHAGGHAGRDHAQPAPAAAGHRHRGGPSRPPGSPTGYANRWFLDPVLRGQLPRGPGRGLRPRASGRSTACAPGDLELIAAADRLPRRQLLLPAPRGRRPGEPRRSACATPTPVGPLTTMGWEQDPSGLHEILTRVRRDYGDIPIYITENGAAFDDGDVVDGFVDDPARVEYLEGHLAALARAIADGVDVRRYFAWSFLDNFEWEHGYEQRFGLVHVDYATQRRVPKRSGLWYRDHIAAARGVR